MKKIKIYLFCKDKLIEWEIDKSQNESVHFTLDKCSTLFARDYTISFECENGFYKVISTEDFVFNHKDQNVDFKFISDGDILICNFLYENSKIILFVQFEDVYSSIFYKFSTKDLREIKIGKANTNDIVYDNPNVLDSHVVIRIKENNGAEIYFGAIGCYVNQTKCTTNEIKFGDVIFVYGLKCVYLGNYIAINNPNRNVYTELPIINSEEEIESLSKRNFINFRSDIMDRQKMYADFDEKKTVVVNPPNIDLNFPRKLLFFFEIPSIIVALIISFIGIVLRDNVVLISGVAIFAISIVIYMILIFSDKSKVSKKMEDYNKYLDNQFKEITVIKEDRVRALLRRYPKTIDCYKTVTEMNGMLWEREISDKDFLVLSIGQGTLNFDNLILNADRASNFSEDHELYKNYENVLKSFKTIKKAPITIPLKEINKLSLVGDMSMLYDVVKNFLVQMTTLHSYKDLRIGFIYSKEHGKNLNYIKEIPHVYSHKRDFRYVASTNEELIDLIYNLKNLISEREAILCENKNYTFDTSYVIFIFYDFSLSLDSFLSYIKKVDKRIDVSFVFITIDSKNVPTSFKYILDIGDEKQTLYKVKDDDIKKKVFSHDYRQVSNLMDIDKFVNALSNIKLLSENDGIKKFDNKSILDLYRVKKVEELSIFERWNKNNLVNIREIPIGLKDNNGIFSLNIHAKHNGPNGIILGESGTGKTEFLKSLILSYGINFHPNKFKFIILKSNYNILLNPFINMPHVMEILDKDNEGERNRLILLIKNEISKRQAIFSSLKVGDISSYLNVYENYANTSVISHIAIIIDDVVMEDREFIKELVNLYSSMSIVGIHIIVSTNKPQLFIEEKDSLLSKFNFRVCFRLDNIKDMFTIMEDENVSNPKHSGLFNVKFVDLDLYKDVEVAFSNVEYEMENDDENLEMVNNCGVVTKKVSRIVYFEDSITQQGAIIEKINEISREMGIVTSSIFNSSLRYLNLHDLVGYSSNFNGFMWCDSKNKLSASIGIIDDPKYQIQRFLSVDFKSFGNLFIYGAPGTGKSTTIKTLVYSLCCEYKPNYLNVYMVDINTRSMDYFGYAPHVKDVAYNRQETNTLFKKVLEEFELRKKIFENLDISSIESYELKTGEKLPYIVLIIDSLQDIENRTWDYTNFIKMLARDGNSYGIFVCITSSEYGDVEVKLSEYFNNKLVLRLNDDSLYKKILGEECSLGYKYKGRGFMRYIDSRGSRILEFQVAMPMDCENDVDLNTKLKSLFIQMNDINGRIYESSDIRNALEKEEINQIELGENCSLLEEENVDKQNESENSKENFENQSLSEVINNFEILPKSICVVHYNIKTEIVMNNILYSLNSKGYKCYLMDIFGDKLNYFDKDKFNLCIDDEDKLGKFVRWISEVINHRSQKEFDLLNEEKFCIFIPEIDEFLKMFDEETLSVIEDIFRKSENLGIYFIISINKKSDIGNECIGILDLLLKDALTILLNFENDLNEEAFALYKSEKILIKID